MLTPDLKLPGKMRLKESRRVPMWNGPIECRMFRFDLVATPDMRIELARVLGYPQIVPRLAFYGLQADEVLAAFDRHARRVEAAPKAPVTCADPDDQIFIDLAVRHRCALLSKDRAVLRMRKRLAALGVHAGIALAHQPA
jgi:predicted nucleic acid-binding protein